MTSAQCDTYVVNPFGNSNGLYIPNIFDNKQSKYHFDSKNSKKPENPENIESGSKIRIRKFWEIFFEIFFFFNCGQFLFNEFFDEMVISSKINT